MILNMRQDYLLKNFLRWFRGKLDDFKGVFPDSEANSNSMEAVVQLLEKGVAEFFPRIMNTGIGEIDLPNRDVNDPWHLPGENFPT